MDLIDLGNILMHIPWVYRLLIKLGLISEGLHELFCERDCVFGEIEEL